MHPEKMVRQPVQCLLAAALDCGPCRSPGSVASCRSPPDQTYPHGRLYACRPLPRSPPPGVPCEAPCWGDVLGAEATPSLSWAGWPALPQPCPQPCLPSLQVGYYPRLIEGAPLVFRGERYAVERGGYNAILTGAAFIDTWTAFPAYWADPVKPGRDQGAR